MIQALIELLLEGGIVTTKVDKYRFVCQRLSSDRQYQVDLSDQTVIVRELVLLMNGDPRRYWHRCNLLDHGNAMIADKFPLNQKNFDLGDPDSIEKIITHIRDDHDTH